jgi:hypothetical protein
VGRFAVRICRPVKRERRVSVRAEKKVEGWAAETGCLLLLRHFPGDFFHQLGPEIGEHAFDDAGDVVGVTARR